MKKTILTITISIILLFVVALPVFAAEGDGAPTDATEFTAGVDTEVYETADMATEGGTASETNAETATESENETEVIGTIGEAESSALSPDGVVGIMGVINDADSKEDAIIKLCEIYGFTVEEAEGYIAAFIAFGDEHFSDNSWWGAVRADIQNNIRTWSVILVVLFAVLVSLVALIINIANKRKQKFQAMQMESFCADMQEKYSSDRRQLTELESFVYENLKRNTDEVNAFRAMVKEFCDALTEKNDQMLSLKKDITRSREVAESTQKLNETSALYNLQVLYLMMGRSKLPIGDATTRKLWYQEHQKELRALMSPDELDEALNQKQGKE